MKKTSYKRGPRFGPDMIKHVQPASTVTSTTPVVIPVIESPVQTVIVEKTDSKIAEVVEATEVTVPVVDERKEIVSEPVVEKQQETIKTNNERRRR